MTVNDTDLHARIERERERTHAHSGHWLQCVIRDDASASLNIVTLIALYCIEQSKVM